VPKPTQSTLDISDEALKDKAGLSEEEQENIAEEAYKEMEDEENGKKKEADDEAEAAEKEREELDTRAEEAGLEAGAELADIEAAEAEKEKQEEENKSDEQKREELDGRAKEVGLEPGASLEDIEAKESESNKSQEEVDALKKKQEEEFDADVKAYAEAEKVPEEEARKFVESIGKVVEKYKGDPKQLAKANLHIQRLFTKTSEDLKTLQNAPPSLPEEKVSLEKLTGAIREGKLLREDGKTAVSEEEVVTAFREDNQDLVEGVEDEVVLKMAVKEMHQGFLKKQKDAAVQMSSEAKEKRATLLNSLSEEDQKFVSDIKPVLENVPDSLIMSEGYTLEDLVLYAYGKHYKEDMKAAIEAAEKKGAENAKILGKKPIIGSGKPHTKQKSNVSRELSDAEWEDAKNKYDGQGMSDDEVKAEYIEMYPEPVSPEDMV